MPILVIANYAIVAGYSRGKLFRTQLVKSDPGYVARTQLLACLKMLTVDACISPDGDLVVACHSGGPDWGSGPTGARSTGTPLQGTASSRTCRITTRSATAPPVTA